MSAQVMCQPHSSTLLRLNRPHAAQQQRAQIEAEKPALLAEGKSEVESGQSQTC